MIGQENQPGSNWHCKLRFGIFTAASGTGDPSGVTMVKEQSVRIVCAILHSAAPNGPSEITLEVSVEV